LSAFTPLYAQVFTDNYALNTGWTHNESTNNSITIQNGKVNFNQNYCGGIDEYQYKPLGFALDNNLWTMDFDWTGTAGSNVGVAGLIASLTSQNTDPAYTTPDTSSSVTNNNTISVLYFSCYGCGSSGSGIEIITKRGTSQYVWHNSLHIPLPFNQTGYIRLERLSANTGMISVFADAARTQHLSGSPRCFPINPAITNLQYLQHGTWVPGSSARYTSGNLDNMVVENNVALTVPFLSIQGNNIAVANPLVGATYQWYREGVLIPNATNQTYTIESTAIYTVCANTSANCQTCSSPIQLGYLGTADAHNIALQISPNPMRSTTFLAGLPNKKHQIQVFSSIGQQIFATYNDASNYTLDLNNYPSGVYFLQIANETWKLIKE
jgi:hypothetical protein